MNCSVSAKNFFYHNSSYENVVYRVDVAKKPYSEIGEYVKNLVNKNTSSSIKFH